MRVPILPGCSEKVFQANYAALRSAGHAPVHAKRHALAAARRYFFADLPEGVLPDYLIHRHARTQWRTRRFYDSKGYPLAGGQLFKPEKSKFIENNETLYRDRPSRKSPRDPTIKGRDPRDRNPVRELPMTAAQRAKVQSAVNQLMSSKGAAVRRAARLYADFSGHEDIKVARVQIPGMPAAALVIGKLDFLGYSTVRDRKAEKYIHRFAQKARPLLAASPDGKRLFMIGGSYNFTDRGIVDKT